MKKRKCLKLATAGLLIIPIAITIQFICFYRILRWPCNRPHGSRADLIAVFRGSNDRIAKGYELANAGVAPGLMISPASPSERAIFDRRYRRTAAFEHVPETRAATTFQNALFVSRWMAAHHRHTVVLVTTDYHLPRAYLLLRLERLGRGTTILPCPAASNRLAPNPLRWSTRQKKQVYNEMVEFWGSLFEMLHFRLTGRLPEKSLTQGRAVLYLRQWLLFEIDH